jgi:predicted dehydrogenase
MLFAKLMFELAHQGGPLEEVGTHWLFGILELFGHDSYRSVHCSVSYPDGPEGQLCESYCSGCINLCCNGSGQSIKVAIDSTSEEANKAGKDIYELEAVGSSGQSFTLYDFTKLRDQHGDDVLASTVECKEDGTAPGTYGRMECIQELVRAVRGDVAGANLVSPAQARNAQVIIEAMKHSGRES